MTEDSTGPRCEQGSQWYDGEAGPLVRPYAMTGGRTSSGPEGTRFDVIALVALVVDGPGTGGPRAGGPGAAGSGTGTDFAPGAALGPEHRAIVELCRAEVQSVAELAAGTDLPVGVVRVLVGDLLESGTVTVRSPVPPTRLPDGRILGEVIDGLRAL
ncbi:DUF742 domain-containing protein [Streptomyces sp. NPDC090306]|uniref:DUF742 domain-containing protein n=1 Tax=Streptomyces sp. NPDC090306 TaxID=3365961 RepID=UPI00381D849E